MSDIALESESEPELASDSDSESETEPWDTVEAVDIAAAESAAPVGANMAQSARSSSPPGRAVLLGPEGPGSVGGVGIVLEMRVMVLAMVKTRGRPSCAVRVTCLRSGCRGEVKGPAWATAKSGGIKEMTRISGICLLHEKKEKERNK